MAERIVDGHRVAPRANLGGANLRGADLYGADLYGADLGGADLGGANLYGAVNKQHAIGLPDDLKGGV